MNICDKEDKKEDKLAIEGHLYYCKDVTTVFGRLALAGRTLDGVRLFSVVTGKMWTNISAFGTYSWIDVTNQYCLTKVK